MYRAINRSCCTLLCNRKMLCAVLLFFCFFFFWNNVEPDNHRTLHEINSESNRKSILKKINYLQLQCWCFWLGFLVSWRKVGSSSCCFWIRAIIWQNDGCGLFGKLLIQITFECWMAYRTYDLLLVERFCSTFGWKLFFYSIFGSYFFNFFYFGIAEWLTSKINERKRM